MRIEITRLEGPSQLCDRTNVFSNYAEARSFLNGCSHTFPKQGYDKHSFKVIFDNGDTHEGRLDCKHFSCENNDLDLEDHVKKFIVWMRNKAK